MDFLRWLFGNLYNPSGNNLADLYNTIYEAFQYEDQRITDEANLDASAEWYANQREVNDISMVMFVIRAMVTSLTAIVVVNIGNLRQYVDARIDNLSSSLSSRIDWFMRIVNILVFGLRLLIDGLKDWVETAVAGPIWNALNAFISRVTGELWTLFQYILHPELLVKLIGGYLFSAWLALLRAFAVPIARYIMRTMFALKGELIGILLDAIAAIL